VLLFPVLCGQISLLLISGHSSFAYASMCMLYYSASVLKFILLKKVILRVQTETY